MNRVDERLFIPLSKEVFEQDYLLHVVNRGLSLKMKEDVLSEIKPESKRESKAVKLFKFILTHKKPGIRIGEIERKPKTSIGKGRTQQSFYTTNRIKTTVPKSRIYPTFKHFHTSFDTSYRVMSLRSYPKKKYFKYNIDEEKEGLWNSFDKYIDNKGLKFGGDRRPVTTCKGEYRKRALRNYKKMMKTFTEVITNIEGMKKTLRSTKANIINDLNKAQNKISKYLPSSKELAFESFSLN